LKYLLDTHVWIWWHTHPTALSKKVKALISDPTQYDEMLLSAISPWELCKLIEKGRLGIACATEDWINSALKMPSLRIVPLSPRIAYTSTVLPQPFHSDPADQIIVASAREENAIVLTKDERIRRYKGVKSLW
jgi:PIN domain nuclease of toxin-antitoxin system